MVMNQEQIKELLTKQPSEMTEEEIDKLIEVNEFFKVLFGKSFIDTSKLRHNIVDENGYKKVYFQPREELEQDGKKD